MHDSNKNLFLGFLWMTALLAELIALLVLPGATYFEPTSDALVSSAQALSEARIALVVATVSLALIGVMSRRAIWASALVAPIVAFLLTQNEPKIGGAALVLLLAIPTMILILPQVSGKSMRKWKVTSLWVLAGLTFLITCINLLK